MVLTTRIREFFLRKAERQPDIPAPQSISISVHDDDELEDENIDDDRIAQQQLDDSELGYAEGQSFIIEYVDSKGNRSTRRITVWGIKEGAGNCPVLVAKCHERNATRTFRVDRIQSIIDYDGVVQEPLEDFLVETFGIARDYLTGARSSPAWTVVANVKSKTRSSSDQRWNDIRRICRSRGVPLLCLLARSDGEFHPDELNVIERYAADCCASESIELNEREIKKINAYLRNLRPSTTAVDRCLDQASNWTNREILGLLETCAHVVKADGQVDQRELVELDIVVRSLTGQSLRF